MSILRGVVLVVVGAFAPVSLVAQEGDPGTSYVYELPLPLAPSVASALESGFDVLDAEPGVTARSVRIVVMPGDERRRFLRLCPDAQVVERGRPFAAIAAERAGAGGTDAPDANYFTNAEIEQELDALVLAYPSLARKVDLTGLPGAARTHGNRPIWALVVSDNVALTEDEPAIVLAAQHHARELNSTFMVIGAMRRILPAYATDPALRAAVDYHELWFVPCVNPDGNDWVWSTDNNWRKNRRANGDGTFGVDLNRNYPTLWGGCGGSTTTSSQTYQGPSAASEPETRTMRALVESVRPELYLDFHSYGQQVLFPYPPCGSAGVGVTAMLSHYVDALRTPMAFGTRLPSASGEAPEDHWNSGGTLGLLTEVGTSFQPVFTTTVNEEARVWPGIRDALQGWRPALVGRVRSIFQAQPIVAEITFAPNEFQLGERTRSRARDGRYGLWLPVGTWQVTWSASGFDPVTRPVTVVAYDQPIVVDVDLVPSWPPATLTPSGAAQIGTSVALDYVSPGDVGAGYWIALSGGTTPGTMIGSRVLPLNPDSLLLGSVNAAPLLVGNLGTLDANAHATASLNLPQVAALVGVQFFAGGITFEPGYPLGVKRWSSPFPIVIAP